MVNRVAINGFGRIGRSLFRAALASRKIKIVAINNLTDVHTMAYLLKYDSSFGNFHGKIEVKNNTLYVNGIGYPFFSERDPKNLPWKELKVDIVAECTGIFRTRELAGQHIIAGAKKVLLSASAKDPIDLTIVKGVNDKKYDRKKHAILSNASCTTNCITPVAKIIDDNFGIKRSSLTTVHGYTSSQSLQDSPNIKDLRRGRAAAVNIVPTSTNAAKAATTVLPHLEGRMDGLAIRVPVAIGSIIDFVVETNKSVSKDDLDLAFKKAAAKDMKGIVEYSEEPLVSTDIIGNPHSAIYDATASMVIDPHFIKVIAWYDNEWGFSKRMVDVLEIM